MRYFMVLLLVCSGASAADERRIYKTNQYGKPLYGEPGFVIQGNKIYKTNQYGKPLYGEPGYVIEDEKIIELTNMARHYIMNR